MGDMVEGAPSDIRDGGGGVVRVLGSVNEKMV
jgi:hypothetical protein